MAAPGTSRFSTGESLDAISTHSLAKDVATVVTFGLIGWALCGATVGVGLRATTLHNTLVIHAITAPIIFAAISSLYFRRFGLSSPLCTATTFLGVVMAMDVLVVALLIQRSFEMFASILGTWLPFLLIFVSTWWTGLAVRRAAHRAADLEGSQTSR